MSLIISSVPMTKEQVDELKRQWVNDPCWDIEDTEGFEDYHDELKAFRLSMEQKWTNDRLTRIGNKAKKWNCSVETAEYIEMLEYRVQSLESKMQD